MDTSSPDNTPALMTPLRSNQTSSSRRNRTDDNPSVNNWATNTPVQRTLGLDVSDENQSNADTTEDHNASSDDESESSTDSDTPEWLANMSVVSNKQDDTLHDEMRRLILLQDASAMNPTAHNKNHADVVRFRDVMGNALETIPCTKCDGGCSWLADSDKACQERLGDDTVVPPSMPQRPTDATADSSTYERNQIKRAKKSFTICTRLRSTCVTLLEEKFPGCLDLKRNRRGLPLRLTIRDAFECVQGTVDSELNRRKAHLRIRDNLASEKCHHRPNSNSCITFLNKMEDAKIDMDTLDVHPFSCEELMLHCREAIRDGASTGKELIRKIDKAWPAHQEELSDTSDMGAWRGFKLCHTKELQALDEDGLLDGPRGRANGLTELTEARLKQIEERIDEQEADFCKFDSALSVVTEAAKSRGTPGGIPHLVNAASDNSPPSRLESHDQSQRICQSLMDERRRNERNEQTIQQLREQPQNARMSSCSQTLDEPTVHTDKNGQKWKQLNFCCSSHGVTFSHGNENCQNRKSHHKDGATFEDRKGGSDRNVDKHGDVVVGATSSDERNSSVDTAATAPTARFSCKTACGAASTSTASTAASTLDSDGSCPLPTVQTAKLARERPPSTHNGPSGLVRRGTALDNTGRPACATTPAASASSTPKRVRFNLSLNQTHTMTPHNSTALRACGSAQHLSPTKGAVDSGATGHFLPDSCRGRCHQEAGPRDAIAVQCANNEVMVASSTDELDIAALPPNTRRCCKFPHMSTPLLSVRKFCKEQLAVLFHRDNVTVCKPNTPTVPIDGIPVLTGTVDPHTDLHMADLHDTPEPRALSARHAVQGGNNHTQKGHHKAHLVTIKTIPLLVNFYHFALGAPPMSSWLTAMDNGWFASWPGLTGARVRKCCSDKPQTACGHLRLQRQHVQSTQPKRLSIEEPKPCKGRSKHLEVEVHVIDDLQNPVAMDITGRCPITSARGHKCIFVMLHRDPNCVRLLPIKSRKAPALIAACTQCCQELQEHGFGAKLLRLDNEASNDLIKAIRKDNLSHQTVSPENHRTNPAERGIQDVKAHFISARSCTDPACPKDCWDLLLPHTEDTLNMLRPSKINPLVSAHTMHHGHHNFMSHPLAPAGCRIVIHDRPKARGSWDDRGTDGFFLEQARDHCRNCKCCNAKTRSARVSDTAEFFPACCEMPTLDPLDTATPALEQLREALSDNRTTELFGQKSHWLHQTLSSLQQLLGIPRSTPKGDNEGTKEPCATSKGGEAIPTDTGPEKSTCRSPNAPKTRSQTVEAFPIGAIVRKRFQSGWYEGEIVSFDSHSGFHRMQCTDGDAEDVTCGEVKQHRKESQRHATNTQFRALRAGCMWDDSLKKWMSFEDLLNHPDPGARQAWELSGEKEFGNPFQGIKDTPGMDVCTFMQKQDAPAGKKVTCPRTAAAHRPEKINNPDRTRITAGGDRLDCDGETSTNGADMVTIKCHWNSVLSTPNAKHCTADASNMHLESHLRDPQCVRFKLTQMPMSIRTACDLDDLVDPQGCACAGISKAWCGLKESGRIANEDVVGHLAECGCYESKHAAGLFTHESRPISFTLVVDDFGTKCLHQADLDHPLASLRKKCKMTVDTEAKQCAGMGSSWDCDKRTLTCSMDDCITDALQELQHKAPKQHCHAPSKGERPDCGSEIQCAKEDNSKPLPVDETRCIQRAVGKLLFMARAVDNTMLHALNDIACNASKGTEATLAATTCLLNCIASDPQPQIGFHASDVILHIDSDAAFQVSAQARSRAGGFFCLGSRDNTLFNAPLLALAKVIENAMGSAAEAEVAAIHVSAQEAVPMRQCLEDMGHSQPATRIRTDDVTAKGFINDAIEQKRSRAFDRQFWWLKDRESQLQFHAAWEPGRHNPADHHAKHHPPPHHKRVRPIHPHDEVKSPRRLQGCIKMLTDGQTKPR